MGAEHSTASASSSSTERTVGRAAMAAAASSSRARVVRRGDARVDDAHVVDSTDDASLVEALERVRSARARAGALDDGFLRPAPSARGGGAETANDEALARALQAEEDAAAERADNGSAVGTASGGESDANACAGCGCGFSGLELALGGTVGALGRRWHAKCLRCDDCGEALSGMFGGEFCVAGKPGGRRQVYHKRCYQQRHRPRCDVCAEFIAASADGYIHFETTPYWGEMTCTRHATDGTPRCDGCRRYEKRGIENEYVTLPDDRKLCMHCVQTVVVDTQDAEPLYRDVLDFFSELGLSALGPGAAELPPLYMCTQDVINHVDEEEAWHRGRTSQVRGMCVSHVETISTVYRQPTWRQANTGSVFDLLGHLDVVEHRIPRSTSQKVTAILVLSCLPRMLAGSILAHECMHMYLRLNGYPHLEPVVEEGLCQLFALLWVERQTIAPGSSSDDAAFGAYVASQIREDPSDVYGVGARRAIAANESHGLREVLSTVKRTGTFPVSQP